MRFHKIHKKILMFVLSISIILSTSICAVPALAADTGTTYYVDSQGGADSNSGTSTGAPWKTLAKVSDSSFNPGDRILLKSGGVWDETLYVNWSGNADNQITIGQYGDGSAPIINGGGKGEAVLIVNQQYVTIQDIEITNFNPAAHDDYKTKRYTRSGIMVQAYHQGAMKGIQLKNLDIHDVTGQSLGNGSWLPDENGKESNKNSNAAIFIASWQWEQGTPTDKIAYFADLLIEDCYIHDVTTVGINVDGQQPTEDLYNKNLIIRNNTITRTGNDFIVVGKSKNPLIESNAGYDAGAFNEDYTYIAGMWVWGTYGATVQKNEVAYIRYYNSTLSDSSAFDTDIITFGDHIYQYNYSHNNAGGFFMSMGHLKDGINIVRYNISQNDGDNGFSGKTINLQDACFFYNNVFYSDTDEGISMTNGATTTFTNNIFYTALGNQPFPANVKFYNNNFYGCVPPSQGINNLTVDPKFVAPGQGGDGMNTVGGYKLQKDSPLIGAGRVIAENGGKDFWGNILYTGSPDIGAFEDPGSTINDTTPPQKPSNLTVKDKTDTSVTLSWSAKENNAALDCEIFNAETGTVVASVYGRNAVTVNDLNPNTEYRFYVVSRDSSGNNSPESDIVTVKTTIAAAVIDNTSSGNVTVTGAWTTVDDTSAFNGSYLRASAGTGLKSVRWTPDLPMDGYYLVSCWVPGGTSTRATNAKFEVKFNGGAKTYTVNEKTASGGWVKLGVHKFAEGSTGYVQLSDDADGQVAADAVRFLYLEGFSQDSVKEVILSSQKMQLRVGEATKLSVTGVDENGNTLDMISEGLDISFSSDNSTSAAISADGLAEALAQGTSNVKVNITINGQAFESNEIQLIIGELFSVGDVEFTNSDGNAITSEPKGLVNASVKVINSQEKKQPVALILAIYDENGFVKYSYTEVTINKYDNATLTASLYIPLDVYGCYAKAFVWDGVSTMRTLAPEASLR